MRSRLPLLTLVASSLLLVPEADAFAPRVNGPGATPAAQPTAQPTARPGHGLPPLEIAGTVPAQNKAIYLGYKGHIDTALSFADFFAADHTVMAWYMPQYPHANTGPIVAENGGGTYACGQDDYRVGDGDNGDVGSPVFYVQVGDKKANYLLPEMIPGKWIHVAVVRTGDTFSLADAETITQGTLVGKQGPKAAHLHFSGSGAVGQSMTVPVAFTNYWASDDEGETWVKVLRGHPRKGQWIKRTE